MCGPTEMETQQANQNAAYATKVQSNYNTLFGEQQGVMQNLNNTLTPIVEAGPSQQGESPAELAAENTQALDTTGANYANAQRALSGQLAAHGTSSGLTTGPEAQLKAALASSAAGQLSNEQLGITQRNYDIGRTNYGNAVGGLEALSGEYAPTAAAGAGTQASANAFGEASTIAQQQAQEEADIAGTITGAAKTAAGGLSGGLTNLASSAAGASQPGAFASGFLNGLG